ncbi:hypothetical protein CDAR_218631 [Caerostris darwini]|uniref:Uncharacterized protein n=1 Tax=Caerostris darwini TaxID=1538125 RepID=A0AAV4VE42_9ARAC|nr:hypothetical protein CDAR_218631 [Caerostris darwini]
MSFKTSDKRVQKERKKANKSPTKEIPLRDFRLQWLRMFVRVRPSSFRQPENQQERPHPPQSPEPLRIISSYVVAILTEYLLGELSWK